MNVLVTGSRGFVGRNLVENLKCIRDGKNRTRPSIHIEYIYEYSRENTPEQLERYCSNCDFVFNLAGVNCPKNVSDFNDGNVGFTQMLLDTLKKCGNKCPVMQSSSIQASLTGRFGRSEYGISKLTGETLLFEYSKSTGAEVYVYRFPNLAGKWIRPNYNSAVATFCHNIANDLPITINDSSVELELLFIDDLIEEMYNAIEGHPHHCDYPAPGAVIDGIEYDGLTPIWCSNGRYCGSPVTHKASLGHIVELLYFFHNQPKSLTIPPICNGSFEKKLYSMYLSYLPKERVSYDLDMHFDNRGSFTELIKSSDNGQFSVNIIKPGITKGQHWHNSKWEMFYVVSGNGLIRERKIGSDEILEYHVYGDHIQAVHMLPGYTHSITNMSETENLVLLIWANEQFDPDRPDTFSECV